MAINSVANSLAKSGDVFTSDDDPELIRDALPFGLKTIETLLVEVPKHQGLLLAACMGYAQYGFAFVQTDADLAGTDEYERSTQLRDRALKLYLRARGYGLRALELRHPGITARLETDPDRAVTAIPAKEQAIAFWTAASWGLAISAGKDRPELLADLAAVRSLMNRALALGESFDRGTIHEALIPLDALPAAMGGSLDRAREHFRRAVELSDSARASPFVTWAENVSVPTQNRAEFERLLHHALDIDPDRDPSARLATLLAQRRARALLGRADELFVDSEPPQPKESR